MKLLQELKRKVTGMGPLRRAWFTTFNLDIEFLETFVLPATIGAEPPRNRIEFEQLQQELTEKGTDVRVFCDPRFIDTNRIKRTCVPIHAIRPDRVSQRFSERSLFHPKVIYLEDANGRRVVGAGSANLTLSGWGRNLEAFVFREVESLANYREIRRFFDGLWDAADIEDVEGKLRERRKFAKSKEKWRFVHSLQNQSFAAQLFDGSVDSDIVVWSPYLPRDLAGFIGKLQTSTATGNLRVHLVPDRIQNKFLRTQWSEELGQMIERGNLAFYDCPVERDHRTDLCHAKIWKIGKALAVGSWNFTAPGSNSLCDDKGKWSRDNNIEAGIIIDDANDWRLMHGKALALSQADCASDELLADEALNPPDLPPFDLHVTFDWHAQVYMSSGAWLGEGARDGYNLRLPGVEALVPLKWKRSGDPVQPSGIRVNDSALLKDRVFRVTHDGKEVHRGIISETNLKSRRAQTFNSLNDLLEALVVGDDPASFTDLPLRGPDDSDSFPDDSPGRLEPGSELLQREISEHSSISYFRLFKAMHDYRKRYSALDNLEQLEKQVFVAPGCLLELVEKARETIQIDHRSVFNWFLANEVATVCTLAQRLRRKLVRGASDREPNYVPAPKSRWESIGISVPEAPNGASPDYVTLVRAQAAYE